MRLLYLIDELRLRGGTERHLWDLAHGLAGRGHEVAIVSLDDGEPFAQSFRDSKAMRYECLKVNRVYGLSGWRGFARLGALMRQMSPHVVQTFHAGADLMGPLAARVSCGAACRISSRRDLGYTKSQAVRVAQRRVNGLVEMVLANSREVVRQAMLQEGLPASKFHVIYNGIDAEPYAHLPPRAPDGTIVLAVLANLRKVKGVHILLEAMKQLVQAHPELRLQVAGGGEELEPLKLMAHEYGLAGRIHFAGLVDDVAGFLGSSDIYVQPSLEEGFSNSVLEAMAAGLPVVATSVGGNVDIVTSEDEGTLVPAGDAPALGRAITALVENRTRRLAMGAAGRRKVMAGFTLPRMLDEYERFYREHARMAV